MKRAFSVALLILLSQQAASAAGVDVKGERAALVKRDQAWAQAAAARDVESIASYWAEDAQVFPPGQPAVVGKAALRRYVSETLAIPGFSISWEPSDFVVSSSGDVAYGTTTNVVTFQDAQGKPVTERARAVTVWRKDPDGVWRCVVDIWNAGPATPAPAK